MHKMQSQSNLENEFASCENISEIKNILGIIPGIFIPTGVITSEKIKGYIDAKDTDSIPEHFGLRKCVIALFAGE